jgi:hypothetical protein
MIARWSGRLRGDHTSRSACFMPDGPSQPFHALPVIARAIADRLE